MKNNKGYTGIDLVITIIIMMISIGVMTIYVTKTINNIQAIKYGVISTSCMIEIAESIDSYSYNNVTAELENTLRNTLNIPEEIDIDINIEEPYVGYIKIVTIDLNYDINGKTENFNIKKLKVVEI